MFINGTSIAGIECVGAGLENKGEGVVVRVDAVLFHATVQENGRLRMTCPAERPN